MFSTRNFPISHETGYGHTRLFKGGSKLDMTISRPISTLPIFSEILEKLMLTRLTESLDKSDINYKHHFDFQKKPKSTTQAVLDLYN